jgi:hypothetical protein
MISCMGGWCTQRGHCGHYHAASKRATPSERLCIAGRDGESDIAIVRLTRGDKAASVVAVEVEMVPVKPPPFDASQIGGCAA